MKDTIKNGETGILADTWVTDYGIRYDLPTIINGINMLISNPEEKIKMGENTRNSCYEILFAVIFSRKYKKTNQ
ncbi:hypothetical protein ACA29_07310 [Lederbergia galactosidilytica]|uniref:Uncharacterized protein n=1 Tax=Lederbergia galactosidilytica TaxID=217031 RepID=A0A0Q9XZD0_9BACI|nr:hypothetical protein ACA29_07310 [Lederbergia galactosidilytica]